VRVLDPRTGAPHLISAAKAERDSGSIRTSLSISHLWVPSLTDLSFVLPTLVLFWCTTGVGWLLTDSDTGWHIRTGDWILTTRLIPRVDMFSFTKTGEPWIAWEWLSDVAMAEAHRKAGLNGVVMIALLLLGATSVWVYRDTFAESGNRLIALAITWLAMAASTVHWLARPHLVTPLMAAIFCSVLNQVEREDKIKKLWILPPLTILWANLHGGFFVGIVLVGTYAMGNAVEDLLRERKQNCWLRARKYAWTIVGCTLASFVNPYGHHLHTHVAEYLGSSFYWKRISEFQSIDFHSFTAAYFETLLVLAIAAAAWHFASGKLTHVILLLIWSHLGLFSTRNIPIFAVVAAPSIGLAIREWLEYAPARVPWMRGFSAAIAEIEAGLQRIANGQERRWHVLPVFCVLTISLLLAHPGRVKGLRAEFSRDRFPVDAAMFLSFETGGSPRRLYSSWQWGGYLIYRLWPSLTVFDDGRTDFYGPAFVNEELRVWNVSPGWWEILERDSVNSVLVPVDSSLTAALREAPEWKLVYQDSVAVLFDKCEEQSGTSRRS
jgi:hypothetical protein